MPQASHLPHNHKHITTHQNTIHKNRGLPHRTQPIKHKNTKHTQATITTFLITVMVGFLSACTFANYAGRTRILEYQTQILQFWGAYTESVYHNRQGDSTRYVKTFSVPVLSAAKVVAVVCEILVFLVCACF